MNATRLMRPYSADPSPKAPKSAHHHEPRPKENDPNDNVKDVETAEHDDRLRRVKPHKRPLVDQEEDDPRDPSHQVAQEPGHVFRQSRLRAVRSWRHGSSCLRLLRIWDRTPRPPPLHCRTCRKRPLCFSLLEVVSERVPPVARRLSPLAPAHKHPCVNPLAGKFAAGFRIVVH